MSESLELPSSVADASSSVSKNSDVSSISVESTVAVMNQEYETQFFGFTPKSFSDGMYNAMLEFTWDCVDGSKQYITSQFPDLESEDDANKGTEALLKKFTGAIDKAFDKFESYLLTNIFDIPNHVLLPEDMVHAGTPSTKDEEQKLDSGIASITEKIKCAKYMNAYMIKELKELEHVQQMYDEQLNSQNKMERNCFEMGVSDLKEAVIFNNEKATKIEGILNKLKPVKQDGASEKGVQSNNDSIDYIRLKKHRT